MLERLQKTHPIDNLGPVATAAEVLACQDAIHNVFVDPKVRRYVVDLVHATRRILESVAAEDDAGQLFARLRRRRQAGCAAPAPRCRAAVPRGTDA